ncbi:tubulin binding cofactor C-domain-containing protein, partial [Gautieria morchelliformis]
LTLISSEIINLRKDLVDATPYLPSYDRGKYEQHLKVLEESLSRYRAPKAKFAFKRTPSASTSRAPPALDSTKREPQKASSEASIVPSTTNLELSSRSSAQLTLSSLVRPTDVPPSQQTTLSRSSDITLTDLTDCIVNLAPRTSPKDVLAKFEPTLIITALHARALSRVVLAMPPIEGSILLHDIHNSIIMVGCHQFRMHNSTNTTVLLHVLSNPIIECSHGIRFGVYPMALCRTSPQSLLERSSKHSMVQDFDWIKSSPSPNWSIVDPTPFEDRLIQVLDNGVTDTDVGGVLKEIFCSTDQLDVTGR